MRRGTKMRRSERRNKGTIVLVIILILVILTAGGLLLYRWITDQNKQEEQPVWLGEDTGIKDEKVEEPKIFAGDERPIAVMIDNHKGAWPHAGLNDAYCVYEIIVEGGETRLMALFKNASDDLQIGPVRSARHYFIDYALEHDAIYTHYGWSPQAESDISTYHVNNINGISQSEKDFWRIKKKAAPHNVLTSIKDIKEIAAKKGYSLTSNKQSPLHYVAQEVELNSEMLANKVTIPYSTLHTTSYVYNPETKRYTRYARGVKQTDYTTGEDITTKNIIITFAENYTLNDGENKDRQGLRETGTKKGYYITNGKVEEITCTKEARTSQTIYQDLNGNVIDVNDGNTFIHICPIDAEVTFE